FTFFIYPEYIETLFENFKPFPECVLKEQITSIAVKIGFPVNEIYMVEASAKTSHQNAYITGVFTKERIVIYDNMVQHLVRNDDEYRGKRLTRKQVVAVVSHELGHWKNNDMHIAVGITCAAAAMYVYLWSHLLKCNDLYVCYGLGRLTEEQPIVIRAIIACSVILSPVNMIIYIFGNIISRFFEKRADRIANTISSPRDVFYSTVKLNRDSLQFPEVDWMYSFCTQTHPSLMDILTIYRTLKRKRRNISNSKA
ncbi:hypothetical protein GJ496_003855, partial [Pomphorhynchus laevis]